MPSMPIQWDEGWSRLRAMLDGLVATGGYTENQIWLASYTLAYNMSTQCEPYNWAASLNDAYREYLLVIAKSPFPSTSLAYYRKARVRVSVSMLFVDTMHRHRSARNTMARSTCGRPSLPEQSDDL